MEHEKMKHVYTICRELNSDEMILLMEAAESIEEKSFYRTIFNFFLEENQKKILNGGFKI